MSEQAGALVVLRPARELTEPITSANVHEAAPDPEAAERVRRVFADAGFDIGPLVGISFSIAGPRELMESWLPDFAEREGTGAELALDRLPADAREAVHAVVSEAPPAFGPGNW